MFEARGGARHGLLVVADADHPFTATAEVAGFAVAARRSMGHLEADDRPPGPFSGAVILFQLEQASNPVAVRRALHGIVLPNAVCLVVTPSLNS